jgi:hypothetical protein
VSDAHSKGASKVNLALLAGMSVSTKNLDSSILPNSKTETIVQKPSPIWDMGRTGGPDKIQDIRDSFTDEMLR